VQRENGVCTRGERVQIGRSHWAVARARARVGQGNAPIGGSHRVVRRGAGGRRGWAENIFPFIFSMEFKSNQTTIQIFQTCASNKNKVQAQHDANIHISPKF
jgi:hypothetical protein